jgi:hypothetical protein
MPFTNLMNFMTHVITASQIFTLQHSPYPDNTNMPNPHSTILFLSAFTNATPSATRAVPSPQASDGRKRKKTSQGEVEQGVNASGSPLL